MNSEITLFARGAKCGFLGRNGVCTSAPLLQAPSVVAASNRSCPSSQARATPLRPPPASNRKSRLDRNCFIGCSQYTSLAALYSHRVHKLLCHALHLILLHLVFASLAQLRAQIGMSVEAGEALRERLDV